MRRLKLGFSLAGFILALLGMGLEDMRLTWTAIAALSVSLILRLYLRRGGGAGRAEGEGQAQEDATGKG